MGMMRKAKRIKLLKRIAEINLRSGLKGETQAANKALAKANELERSQHGTEGSKR